MMYIPVNIKTGMQYPAVSEAEMSAMKADKTIGSKYRFEEVPEKQGQGKEQTLTPQPIEARKPTPKAKDS